MAGREVHAAHGQSIQTGPRQRCSQQIACRENLPVRFARQQCRRHGTVAEEGRQGDPDNHQGKSSEWQPSLWVKGAVCRPRNSGNGISVFAKGSQMDGQQVPLRVTAMRFVRSVRILLGSEVGRKAKLMFAALVALLCVLERLQRRQQLRRTKLHDGDRRAPSG